jgi:hypothetical protein
MLLESSDAAYLSFEINKGLTLRTFLGQDRFKDQVKTSVKLVENDPFLCVVLLDKIKEEEEVIRKLIYIQLEQF